MPRPGPPPKPTALKLLRGNPGRRPVNTREPKPKANTRACPKWLSAEAQAAWKLIVPELKKLGLFTAIDTDALVIYCDTWSRWKRAVRFLQEHGDTYAVADADGNERHKTYPQVGIARSLLPVLNRYAQEFGMTPSARSRIEIKADEPSGGVLEFLGLAGASTACHNAKTVRGQ